MIRGFSRNIESVFPIDIGTIPLVQNFHRLRSSIRRPRPNLVVNLPPEDENADAPPPAYEDLFPVELLNKYPDIRKCHLNELRIKYDE